jgi:hypothetical protein
MDLSTNCTEFLEYNALYMPTHYVAVQQQYLSLGVSFYRCLLLETI